MEDALEFLAKLEQAILLRRSHINERQMPRLKESFHAYQLALRSVLNLLLRKSLIKEDPYKHDQKIGEITIPSNDDVLETEKDKEISIRLSDLDSQLDFLNNFYNFSADFLNLTRVRLLSRLVNYIDWENLSDTSGSINTRLVAELFSKVRLGGDKLSASVLNDAHNQLTKITGDILALLRDLTSYHRERYKMEMRKGLFAGLELDRESVAADREGALRRLKARFAQLVTKGRDEERRPGLAAGTPYYPELLSEVLDEDFSDYAENLRLGILEKLQVPEERKVRKTQSRDYRPILFEALRLIGTAASPLESAVQKLLDNAELLDQRKLGFAAKLRRWLAKLVHNETPRRLYEVELADPQTGITKIEKLDFTAFAARALKRCKLLDGMSNKMSPAYLKLAEAGEQQVEEFLSSSLDELHLLSAKMPAVDAYFKARLARDDKGRLKGVKMEINAIKNAVVKANQKLHEYTSRREEEQQLQRLGIDELPG